MYITCAHRVKKAVSNPLGLELRALLAIIWELRTGPLQAQQVPLLLHHFFSPSPFFEMSFHYEALTGLELVI